jgi:uncharacterized membrane protein YkoI
MLSTIRKGAMTAAGLGALALGGSAVAGAADSTTSSDTSSSGTSTTQTRPGRPQREPLSADVAAKVKAAALEKVPGATVLRTEAGGPYGTPYHAHIKKPDGTLQVVLVNSDFQATAVQADRARGGKGRGDHGHGRHGGGGETALTGATKDKVEAAVLAKYDGATILRTETNEDSSAPYESHIKTSDGKELEVLVSKDFVVVEANEHPAHR